MVKYAKKNSHTCNHSHTYGINMKKLFKTSWVFKKIQKTFIWELW